MPSKSILKHGFKAEADRLAEKYRAELNISKFDPLDAFKLAEHLLVQVFTVDEIFEDNESDMRYAVLSNKEKFNAMWMPNSDGEKIIIHNSNHSCKRQQSNLMHELAHIIRGHEIPDEAAIMCRQFNLPYINPLHEQEAKFLGGCLQLTRPGLQWALKNNLSYEQISDYYTASKEMVNYRIKISGVERQQYYKRLNQI